MCEQHMHVYTCKYVCSLKLMLEIVLHWSFTSLIEAEFSQSNPVLTNMASLTNELVLWTPCLSFGSWNHREATMPI